MSNSPPVQAALRSARLRARLARGVEHLLAGGAAASVVLAAAALSGAPTDSPGALVLAGLSGALALATLAFERRESALQFARRMDARLAAAGAIATAFECEVDPEASAIARLHARRTAARFSAAQMRRAVPSPSLAFVAVLLAGAALVALARQKIPQDRSGAARELASARSLAAGSSSSPSENARGTGAAEEPLASQASSGAPSAPGGVAQPVSEGAEGMQVPGTATAGGDRGSSAEPVSQRSAAGSEPAGAPRPEGGTGSSGRGAGSGTETPALTGASGGSTMSVPPPEPGMPSTAISQTTSSGTPAAAPSGRWWPRRYDAVVARYVERTRAAISAGAAPR
jgi:hypothetical protein